MYVYLTMKKDDILQFPAAWNELEGVGLNEVENQKDKVWMSNSYVNYKETKQGI